ncbi:MAG TPA: glycosyltransferase family 2 protein [Pyrinomonadaceae bacterium]|nr:glycosyltransferase family 2 protein [Pyrinomonadaceae bacterium]
MKSLKIVPTHNNPAVIGAEPNDALKKPKPHLFDNSTLSVIVRFHQSERLNFLEEALFSLALQNWSDLEPIIVLQNGTDDLKQTVADMLDHQPWQVSPKYKIVSVQIPEGTDGRSILLNRGIEAATGRYLSFLDDDDCVYHDGYTTLIRQLIGGERAVAVGGCRRAQIGYENDHWFTHKKDNFFAWGRTLNDLFTENFVPIHSYVIDRARLGNSELKFDESFTLLEDYDFVLRLFAAHEPDFALLDKPVCEYRIRLDGSNSIAHTSAASPEVIALQQRAWLMIKESKKNLYGKYFSDKNINDFLESTPNHAGLESGAQGQNGGDRDRRVLLKIVLMMYDFFSRYPRLERRLSKTLHLLWGTYKKLNHSASTD